MTQTATTDLRSLIQQRREALGAGDDLRSLIQSRRAALSGGTPTAPIAGAEGEVVAVGAPSTVAGPSIQHPLPGNLGTPPGMDLAMRGVPMTQIQQGQAAMRFGQAAQQIVPTAAEQGIVQSMSGIARLAQSGIQSMPMIENAPKVILGTLAGKAMDVIDDPSRIVSGQPGPATRDILNITTQTRPLSIPEVAARDAAGGVANAAMGADVGYNAILPERANEPYTAEWFAANLARMAPQMGVNLGTAAIGGAVAGPAGAVAGAFGPSFLLEAGSQAESIYRTRKMQGASDEEALTDAFVPSVIYGAGAAAIETMSGPEAMVANRVRGKVAGYVRELVSSAIGEGVEEAAQGTLQDVTQLPVTGEFPSAGEFLSQRAQEAALGAAGGALFGGAMGLGGHAFGGAQQSAPPTVSEPVAPAPGAPNTIPASVVEAANAANHGVPQPAQGGDQGVQNVDGEGAVAGQQVQDTGDPLAPLMAGEVPGVVVPRGMRAATPPGMRMEDMGRDGRVVYDPRRITRRQVLEARAQGRLAEVLGAGGQPTPTDAGSGTPAPSAEAQPQARGTGTTGGTRVPEERSAGATPPPGSTASQAQPSLDSQITALEAETQQGMRDQARRRDDRMDQLAAQQALEAQRRPMQRREPATRPFPSRTAEIDSAGDQPSTSADVSRQAEEQTPPAFRQAKSPSEDYFSPRPQAVRHLAPTSSEASESRPHENAVPQASFTPGAQAVYTRPNGTKIPVEILGVEGDRVRVKGPNATFLAKREQVSVGAAGGEAAPDVVQAQQVQDVDVAGVAAGENAPVGQRGDRGDVGVGDPRGQGESEQAAPPSPKSTREPWEMTRDELERAVKRAKQEADAEEAIRARAESLGLSRKGPLETVRDRLTEHEKANPSETQGTLADWADKKIAEIKKNRNRRQIKRGRNTGSSIIGAELRDAAAVAFLRALKAGDLAGRALMKHVREAIEDLGAKADEQKVRRIVKGMIADSKGEDGTITEEVAERAVEDLNRMDDPRPPETYEQLMLRVGRMVADEEITYAEGMERTKKALKNRVQATADAATGVTKPKEEKSITPGEALRASILAVKRAAPKIYKQGVEDTSMKLGMRAMREFERFEREIKRLQETTIPARRAVSAYRRARRTGQVEGARNLRETLIPKLRQQAKDARDEQARKFKDRAANAAERRRIEQRQIDTLRRTLTDAIRENLPRSEAGKYLSAVRDVRTYGAFLRALSRVERDTVLYEGRRLRRRTTRIKAKDLGLLEPEIRQEADAAMGAIARVGLIFTPEGQKGLSYADLVIARDELRAALSVVQGLIATQKQEDRVRIKGELLEAEDLRKDVKNTLANLKQLDAEDSRSAPDKSRIRRFLARRTNWEHLMRAIDGFKSGGVGMRIFGRVLAAREQAAKIEHGFRDQFAKIVTDNGYKSLGHYLAEMSGTLGDRLQKWVDVPIGGHERITLGQAAYLYASAGDAGFMARIRAGQALQWRENPTADEFTITEADLAKVAAAIPENVRKIIDEGKALYDRHYFPLLSAVNKRLKGYHLEKVPGYWGIKLNRSYSEGKGTPQSWRKQFIRAMEEAGYMQERVGPSKTPILIGDFGTDLVLRSKSSATVIAKAEVVKTMSRVFLHKDTQNAITHTLGAEQLRRLEHRISLFSGGELYREATEKQLRKFLSRWARGKTQLWIPTWFRNAIGGTIKIMNELPAGSVMKAALTPSWNAWKDLMAFSATARERWNAGGLGAFYSHDGGAHVSSASVREAVKANLGAIGQAMAELLRGEVGGAADAFKGFGKSWDAFLDSLTIGNFFDAVPAIVAYKVFLRKAPANLEGDSKKRWAARHAMRAFERTANTADVAYANDIQIEARESLLVASFVPFTGDTAKSMTMIAESYRKGPRAFARTSVVIAASVAASSMVGVLWKLLMGERDEDKLKDTALQRVAMELLSLIPGIGNPLSQFAPRAMFGSGTQTPELASPFTEVLNTAWSAVADVMDGIDRWYNGTTRRQTVTAEDKFMRAAWKMVKIAGDAWGVPTHYATELRRAFERYTDGE